MPDALVATAIREQTGAIRKQAMATLAAAMVQVRGNTTPEQIQRAIKEAGFLLFPPPGGSDAYDAWAKENLPKEE